MHDKTIKALTLRTTTLSFNTEARLRFTYTTANDPETLAYAEIYGHGNNNAAAIADAFRQAITFVDREVAP